MECPYCKKILSSVSSLNYHKNNTKFCLNIQGKILDKKVDCEYCNIIFSSKTSLKRHLKICKHKYK